MFCVKHQCCHGDLVATTSVWGGGPDSVASRSGSGSSCPTCQCCCPTHPIICWTRVSCVSFFSVAVEVWARSSCCGWMWELFIALERDNTTLAARVQHVEPSQPSPAASFLSGSPHLLCARCRERGQEGEGLVIPGTSPWQHLLFFFRFFFLPWASWYYFTVVCLSFQGSPSPISSCAFSSFCPFCTASTSLLVVGSW